MNFLKPVSHVQNVILHQRELGLVEETLRRPRGVEVVGCDSGRGPCRFRSRQRHPPEGDKSHKILWLRRIEASLAAFLSQRVPVSIFCTLLSSTALPRSPTTLPSCREKTRPSRSASTQDTASPQQRAQTAYLQLQIVPRSKSLARSILQPPVPRMFPAARDPILICGREKSGTARPPH